MKIELLPERCIACGLCQTYSPIFDYDDDGIVKLADSDDLSIELASDPQAILAVKSCPTKALEIRD